MLSWNSDPSYQIFPAILPADPDKGRGYNRPHVRKKHWHYAEGSTDHVIVPDLPPADRLFIKNNGHSDFPHCTGIQ